MSTRGRYMQSCAWEIKPNGLQWAVHSQLIRRAGLVGAKKIKHEEADGAIQVLRTDDAEMTEGEIDESRDRTTGGQEFEPFGPEGALSFLGGEEDGSFRCFGGFRQSRL